MSTDALAMTARRYRWAVLAAGTTAQASFSTLTLGLPAIAPALRDEFGLDLRGVGLLFAALWLGIAIALLPWGFLVDRVGERGALGVGLAGCGGLLASLAVVDSFRTAAFLLGLAGAIGASVQSASGRAVMQWFRPAERGLAFGVRQTAVVVGGFVGALVLPALVRVGGTDAAFLFLGVFCVAAASAGFLVVRGLPRNGDRAEGTWTLRDARLWLLCGGSGFYVATQIVLLSFLVLFLHDERGLSAAAAAAALALVQGLAAVLRLAVGRWSDIVRSRVVPLRWIGLGVIATLAPAALVLDAPTIVLVPLLVTAGALSAAWNGLSFAAAAELAGHARSGVAIGFQQTVLSLAGVVVPPAFAAVVQASSWRTGFVLASVCPLVGWVILGRVRV